MADVPLENFLPDIRPAVPGCPDDVMKHAVRRACIQLCAESWIIRQDIEPGDITAGVDDYLITPGSFRDMVAIVSILYNNVELPKMTEEELDYFDYGWRTREPGVATAVTMTQPDRIRLNRVPAETTVGGFIPRVVTKPTQDAPQVDVILYRDWSEAIKNGALSFLLEIPGKKWSDAKQSVWYGKKFNAQIQQAKDRANMSYFKKSTNVRPVAWV